MTALIIVLLLLSTGLGYRNRNVYSGVVTFLILIILLMYVGAIHS